MSYVNEYIKLSTAAEEYIRNILSTRKEILLFVPENEDETIYDVDLPIHYEVSKHGFYCEYALTKVWEAENGEMLVDGTEKGESGDEDSFTLSCLTAEEIIYLADKINSVIFNE